MQSSSIRLALAFLLLLLISPILIQHGPGRQVSAEQATPVVIIGKADVAPGQSTTTEPTATATEPTLREAGADLAELTVHSIDQDGNPLLNFCASVHVDPSGLGTGPNGTEVAADCTSSGSLVLSSIPVGTYFVTGDPLDGTYVRGTRIAIVLSAPATDITILHKRSEIEISVVDELGSPVEACFETWTRIGEYFDRKTAGPLCDGDDGAIDGIVRSNDVPVEPVPQELVQTYSGTGHAPAYVVWSSGSQGADGVLRFSVMNYTSTLVTVRRTDLAGNLVPGSCVSIGAPNTKHTAHTDDVSTTCDADDGALDGMLYFHNVKPRTYMVIEAPAPPGYTSGGWFDFTLSGPTVEVTIATASLTPTATSTATQTPTPTSTPTETSTTTPSPSPTATVISTPTSSPSTTATPSPTREPTASATPTLTTTSTATPRPRISGDPSGGIVGRTLHVSIRSFPASTRVAIYYDGARKVTLTTDPVGKANGSFKVPASAAGSHTVLAKGGGASATTSYTVVPRLKLSPSNVTAGGTFRTTLTGFAPNSTVKLRLYERDGSATVVSVWSLRTDRDGNGGGSFRTKRATMVGAHVLRATDSAGNVSATTLMITRTRPACDPSYPDVCIPSPPPDLDCGDISFRLFRVVGRDPHSFDVDRDGIGCESR